MKILNNLDYIEDVAKGGSIRKAAQHLAITATALNRRILALEEEIGTPIFERLPSGVRLNSAGELFLQHIRGQSTDLTRVLSQISDMSGLRRGHVRLSICADAQGGFIPKAIAAYREQHSGVTFDVRQHSTDEAIEQLETLKADIAFSFEALPPIRSTLISQIAQNIHVALHRNHPLAQKQNIRLHECRNHPVIFPNDGTLRTILDVGLMQQQLSINPIFTCDDMASILFYLHHENSLAFHFALTQPNMAGINSVPVHPKDLPVAQLKIYKTKGRLLPVPAAKFLDYIMRNLNT